MTLPLSQKPGYPASDEPMRQSRKPASIHKHPALRRQEMYRRAARAKQRFEQEMAFHRTAARIRASGDWLRQSYLHWILEHMFSRFDYATGLQAMRDEAQYQQWRRRNDL